MPEQPSPLNATNLQDALRQMQQLLDDLYNERLAGAKPGNVFEISEQEETLNLKIQTNGGLSESGGELSVLVDPAGCVTKASAGLDVSAVSTLKKGAAPILSGDATEYLDGTGVFTVPATTTGLTQNVTVCTDIGPPPVYAVLHFTTGRLTSIT